MRMRVLARIEFDEAAEDLRTLGGEEERSADQDQGEKSETRRKEKQIDQLDPMPETTQPRHAHVRLHRSPASGVQTGEEFSLR